MEKKKVSPGENPFFPLLHFSHDRSVTATNHMVDRELTPKTHNSGEEEVCQTSEEEELCA